VGKGESQQSSHSDFHPRMSPEGNHGEADDEEISKKKGKRVGVVGASNTGRSQDKVEGGGRTHAIIQRKDFKD